MWSESNCAFTIDGNPSPQCRYGLGRRKIPFDPCKEKKRLFKAAAKEKLSFGNTKKPLFEAGKFLAMTVVFKMKRPKSHFISNNRHGSLKANAPNSLLVAKKVDVDNLVKFVMDALVKLLYDDDKQIAAVHAFRMYDNVGSCLGSTTVRIEVLSSKFPACCELSL
jgi:Holliday junction resolvase RusA-like endonuclease